MLTGYQAPAALRRTGRNRLETWLRNRKVRAPKALAEAALEAAGQLADLQWWADPLTGAAYAPANYQLHGSGLFFAGLEWDGTLHVYGLNSDGTFTTFGTIPTGKTSVMDVTFDAGTRASSRPATTPAVRRTPS